MFPCDHRFYIILLDMALAQSYELLYLLSPCILFRYIPHRLVTGNLSSF